MSKPVIKSYVNTAISAVEAATYSAELETVIKVTSQAKSLAPVDTGEGKNSIMWVSSRSEGGNQGGPKLSKGGLGKLAFRVGTAVLHMLYQEFGTRFMAAQAFLRPAVFIVTEGASYTAAMARAMADTVREKMRGVR